MEKQKILLIGGGGHCHSVIDVIEMENRFEIAGIIDKKELIGTKVLDYDIIGCDEDLESLFQTYKYAFITVGQLKTFELRKKLFSKLTFIGYKLPCIISPLAYVSKYAKLEEGTVIMHHALINANAKVGKNCIINTKALVEHDAIIEKHCHISTAAVINGGVIVEEGTFVGSNAVTKQGITIPKKSFVNAGSLQL